MTKQTIVYDLENYTFPEHQEMLKMMVDKINLNTVYGGTGVKTMYYMAGRRTGKSMLSQIYNTNLCNEIMLPEKPESKYKFSRAKWYTVECTTWRFSDEYNQIIEWCTENFGPHPEQHDAWSRWYAGLGYINFRDQKDYNWYILRWGA